MKATNTMVLKVSTLVWLALAAMALLVAGCDSVEPDDGPGEEELITTVELSLTSDDQSHTASATFTDLDGEGGNAPTITDLVLKAGLSYTGTITFTDASDASDPEDITAEVKEEDDEHQVWYDVGSSLSSVLTMTITDEDGGGLPLGLAFTAEVAAASAPASGTVKVSLNHYDDVTKTGTNRSDETDVEVDFPVSIEE